MRRKYANFDEFEPNRKITTEEDGEFLTCLKQALLLSLKEIDLLTYLQNYNPEELKYDSRNSYKTATHDSLKISNGLWYWFTKQVGGKNAIDYLIKVRNYSFINAVQTVMGNIKIQAPIIYKQEEKLTEAKDNNVV